MPLLDLPNELLQCIWDVFESKRDMNAFVQTCQRLYDNFNTSLYRYAVVCDSVEVGKWVAEHGPEPTMQKLLDQGFNPPEESPCFPICLAARCGRKGMVKLLLENGVSPNATDEDGQTPLFCAAVEGHVSIIRFLLEKGAIIDAFNFHGVSPLLRASALGQESVVAFLLENRANADLACLNGQFPLSYAIEHGHVGTVKLFLERTSTMDLKDIDSGLTPLMWAARTNRPEIASLLIEAGANMHTRDGSNYTALSWAVHENATGVAALLLDAGASPDLLMQDRRPPLSWAAEHGYSETVRVLLAHDVPIDEVDDRYGLTALQWAARGDYDIVKQLLEAGADVNMRDRDNETALGSAASYDQDAIARLLLEAGADVDAGAETGEAPLFRAAKLGNARAVQVLLENGACVEKTCEHGDTPLQVATVCGHEDVVRLLLQKGANPNLENEDFPRPPIFLASTHGYDGIVKLLLENGANPDAVDEDGYTVLSNAIQMGKSQVVLALLDDGTDPESWSGRHHEILDKASDVCPSGLHIRSGRGRHIDTPDRFNRTPLFLATFYGYEDIVRILLSRGSSAIQMSTSAGRTPLSFAEDKKDLALASGDNKLQSIWQLLKSPSEATVDMKSIEEQSSGNGRVSFYQGCNSCKTPRSRYDTYFRCPTCYDGDYYLCLECAASGATCLDAAHMNSYTQ